MRTLAGQGFAIMAAGFDALVSFDSRAQSAAEAQQRLHNLGQAYLDFAEQHYGLWRLMFGPYGVRQPAEETWPHPIPYEWLAKVLAELADQGLIDTPTP